MSKMKDDNDESNPPLMATYKHLLDDPERRLLDDEDVTAAAMAAGDEVLPVIDLQDVSDKQCRAAMVRAASEWGFFQVTNHGVPQPLLDDLHEAQVAAFRRPFHLKLREPLLDFSPESYRWGTPTATSLEQLSWSEAYHIPMTTTTSSDDIAGDLTTRRVIEEVSSAMSKLALKLAGILVAGLAGDDDDTVVARCTRRDTCFLRLNRYPPAASGGGRLFGLCPHTDSDFLTILHQDGVGGLQLRKDDGRWVAVRPNPGALIVNVGDLLQAWSNDRYQSAEHRVVAGAAAERFSVAFFLCPAHDTLIRPLSSSGDDPPRYRSFTFGEYRDTIKEDVRLTGRKIGLQRFRLPPKADAAH